MYELTLFFGEDALFATSVPCASIFLACMTVLPTVVFSYFLIRWWIKVADKVLDPFVIRAAAPTSSLRMQVCGNDARTYDKTYDAKKWTESMKEYLKSLYQDREDGKKETYGKERAVEAIKRIGDIGTYGEKNDEARSNDLVGYLNSPFYSDNNKKLAGTIKW